MSRIIGFLKWVFGNRARMVVAILIILAVGFLVYRNIASRQAAPRYQTAQAQKGSLIQSVTASGTVTNSNNVQVTIQAAGVVKDVYVKNGDTVSTGQTLATLTLDQASQQKQASADASYLSAQNSLANAKAKINSLQSAEFTANQKFINDAVARDLATDDPTYIEENASWLQAEADYKNQQGAVAASQASLSAASIALSQVSSTITAPASGVVKGLTITPGSIVTVSSSSSNSTSTSQVLGSIYQQGSIQAQVSLSEIDSVNVKEGQKATMTLDAFPDKTFTGAIASIDTNGVVSSGVITYPAVITFDSGEDNIYPNMTVTANIITNVENEVVLVPSAAVQTAGGASTVRVLKNNQVQTVNVQTGDSNDTQTVITAGVSEGDTVVTGAVTPATGTSSSGTSPFGGGRGFGGGGVILRGGGGRGG